MKMIGPHVSIKNGIENAPKRAYEIGAKSFAMFLTNQRQWKIKPLTEKNIKFFIENLNKYSFDKHYILPHSSYLINLCSPKKDVLEQSIKKLIGEMNMCSELGLDKLNIHPGSSLKMMDKSDAIKQVAESINAIFDKTSKVKIVLENTAGGGGQIGDKFENIKSIINYVDRKERIGICLDICHLFAAGYDIKDKISFNKTMYEFSDIIGLCYLEGIHLNDSKGNLGSHIDRHENIGKGKIGINVFKYIMNCDILDNTPMILETPNSNLWAEEIKILYNLVEVKYGNRRHNI